jgi:hypothetical protein
LDGVEGRRLFGLLLLELLLFSLEVDVADNALSLVFELLVVLLLLLELMFVVVV